MKNFLLFSFFCIIGLVCAQTPMITEWEFTDGTSTELHTRGNADYIIKDASDQIVSSGSLTEGPNTINVSQTGIYTMEISNSSNFAFMGKDVNFSDVFPKEMRKFLQWGDTDLNEDLRDMFSNSEIEIIATDIPDFKPNTSLYGMFFAAKYFTGDLSAWDVSNVTNMQQMFMGANSFTSDLSGWDVSNVIIMSYIFAYAPSFTSDLSDWDVSSVVSMYTAFKGASSFTSDLSNWDISSLVYMESMFDNSGMTCNDYTSTLIGWSNQDVNPDIKLGAENIHYGPAAVDARNFLINSKGWIFAGDTFIEDCALGMNDTNLISDIKVINPVKERIQLITEEKIDRVIVYNASGKKVKEFKGTTASAGDMPKGIYILRIQTANGIKSIKVLKE